jgi:hypothetical protein
MRSDLLSLRPLHITEPLTQLPPKAYPYISAVLISSIWPLGQYLFQKVKSDEQTRGVEIGFATHKERSAAHCPRLPREIRSEIVAAEPHFTGVLYRQRAAATYFISTPLVGAPMRDRDSMAKDL